MFLIGKAVDGSKPFPCRVTFAPWEKAMEEARALVIEPHEKPYIWAVTQDRDLALHNPVMVH